MRLKKLKISKNVILRKALKAVFSKSFLGAFLFGIALWSYTSLNEEYRTNIVIPLSISLPETRAMQTAPPDNITLYIKGTGWQIFNLLFSSNAVCNIDLSRIRIQDSVFNISRDYLMKNIQFLNNVQALEVIPDNIDINTGYVGEYSVPIEAQVFITPKNGYTLVGDIQIKPDLVIIKGNDLIAKNITKWTTKPYFFENPGESINTQIQLSDSLAGVINTNISSIKLFAEIQQIAEVTIPDVPVKVRGGNIAASHIIEPLRVSVTVKGGIKNISYLSPESITAYIDAISIINDSTGIIRPLIKTPENIQVLKVNPPYVYHKIRIK